MQTLLTAVEYRDEATVRRLAGQRAGLEDRDSIGATPLIVATSSDQFVIAEILIDAGADVFAADRMGVTAGRMAEISNLSPASVEGRARTRVLEKMAAKGFPFPSPTYEQVVQMRNAGHWPPLPAGGR